MHILRLTGFTIALVAAVVVFLVLGPNDTRRLQPIAVTGNQELIDQALADYQANSTNAGEDLDLQVVTNGWVARDLLYVLAIEFDAISEQISVLSAQTDAIAESAGTDDRVPALLLIGVITLAFHAATAPFVPPPLAPSPLRAPSERQSPQKAGSGAPSDAESDREAEEQDPEEP